MEKYIENYSENRRMKKVALGVIVVVIGALLMASNFGYLPYRLRHIFLSWEMLLIAIGLINVVNRESKTMGLILISVGTFFLLPDIFRFDFNFVRLFWPVLLMVVGFSLILYGGKSFNWQRHRRQKSTFDSGFINEFNVFGGSKRRVSNQVFKGGELNNIFGGSELDMTQAILGEGENLLEVQCIFGGVGMVVPADWNVRIEVVSIFGGFSDKRAYIKKSENDTNVLVIRGTCIFGGGEIKSY
ncbi:MAG: cell wall-active antibiotics response protein [Bacteroidetes bacterium]|nr:cell wall-active antibiotics response protein [Bacteroidota bacterium]